MIYGISQLKPRPYEIRRHVNDMVKCSYYGRLCVSMIWMDQALKGFDKTVS